MNLRRKLTGWALGAAAVMGTMAMAGSAQAGDYPPSHCSQPQYTYKSMTVWVKKKVPYFANVILYKPCGTPYYGQELRYKWINVPVQKTIRVAY
ncbi:MAG: hypothetical protein KDB22_13885 [Planctomycetales bacterium]|nr:hypothetical protein [Planctomycetales bacterium]